MSSQLRFRIHAHVLVLAAVTALVLVAPAMPQAAAGSSHGRPRDPAVARMDARYGIEDDSDGGDDGTGDESECDDSEDFQLAVHRSCESTDSGPAGSADTSVRLDAVISTTNDNVTKITASGSAFGRAETAADIPVGHGGQADGFLDLGIDVQANTNVPYSIVASVQVSAAAQTDCTSGELDFGGAQTPVSTGTGCSVNDPNSGAVNVDSTLSPGSFFRIDARLSTGTVEKTTPGPGTRTATTSFTLTVTFKAACTIVGTEGDDDGDTNPSLLGTPQADVICGLGGDDDIKGLGGDDKIFGNEGCLSASGGPGDDRIVAGAGTTDASCTVVLFSLNGDAGDDTIIVDAAPGVSIIDAGDGADHVTGHAGKDFVFGGGGADVVHAGDGVDMIFGDDKPGDPPTGPPGGDALFGEGGEDEINGGGGADFIDGGPDPDEIDGGPGVFNDHILGGDTPGPAAAKLGADDIITGGPGDDFIECGSGGDQVQADAGDDVVHGEGGRDQLQADVGEDTLDGGPMGDVLEGEAGPDHFLARDQTKDQVKGGPDEDTAFVDRADVVTGVEHVHRPPASHALG